MITKKLIMSRLKTVMDSELHINIVDLGLIYDVSVSPKQTKAGKRDQVHIVMTLTTPGCPLSGVFDKMVRDALADIPRLDTRDDVTIELTFDPPWIIDMMNEEVRAQLDL